MVKMLIAALHPVIYLYKKKKRSIIGPCEFYCSITYICDHVYASIKCRLCLLLLTKLAQNQHTLHSLSSLVSLFFFFFSLFPQCDWGGVVWGHRRQRVLQWSWRKVGSPIYCCCGYCAAACSEQVTLTRTHTLTSDSKAQKEDDPFCAEKLRAFNDGGVAELAINRCHTKTHPFALSWPLLSSASFLHH